MEGKSILITGCSSGIGLCVAEGLFKRGYRVFATARKQEDVKILLNKGGIMKGMDKSKDLLALYSFPF